MAGSNYFKFFDKITVDGKLATNIFRRFQFLRDNTVNNRLFYEYYVKDGERPDVLAHKYYGDSKYDWVILLFNNIYDPATQWVKDTNEFNKFLIQKYGSLTTAFNTVHHYENADGFIIDEDTYNGLPTGSKSEVSVFEHESRLNEAKREIKILDSSYLLQVVRELKDGVSNG